MRLFSRLRARYRQRPEPTVPQMLLSFLCVAINCLVGVFNFFSLRDVFMLFVDRMGVRHRAWNPIEMAAALVLCILALVVIHILQAAYEREFTISWFPKLFLIVLGIQALLYAGAQAYLNF